MNFYLYLKLSWFVLPIQKENHVDENVYPEFYRKSENIKGSNNTTPQPFIVGIVENIENSSKNGIKIKARLFCRAENTINSGKLAHIKDLNYLYYTEVGKQCLAMEAKKEYVCTSSLLPNFTMLLIYCFLDSWDTRQHK